MKTSFKTAASLSLIGALSGYGQDGGSIHTTVKPPPQPVIAAPPPPSPIPHANSSLPPFTLPNISVPRPGVTPPAGLTAPSVGQAFLGAKLPTTVVTPLSVEQLFRRDFSAAVKSALEKNATSLLAASDVKGNLAVNKFSLIVPEMPGGLNADDLLIMITQNAPGSPAGSLPLGQIVWLQGAGGERQRMMVVERAGNSFTLQSLSGSPSSRTIQAVWSVDAQGVIVSVTDISRGAQGESSPYGKLALTLLKHEVERRLGKALGEITEVRPRIPLVDNPFSSTDLIAWGNRIADFTKEAVYAQGVIEDIDGNRPARKRGPQTLGGQIIAAQIDEITRKFERLPPPQRNLNLHLPQAEELASKNGDVRRAALIHAAQQIEGKEAEVSEVLERADEFKKWAEVSRKVQKANQVLEDLQLKAACFSQWTDLEVLLAGSWTDAYERTGQIGEIVSKSSDAWKEYNSAARGLYSDLSSVASLFSLRVDDELKDPLGMSSLVRQQLEHHLKKLRAITTRK